jgi:dihydroceramide fatty acyl 2-hydroxylase
MTSDSSGRSLSDSPRIFENPLLDRLSRIDHRVPVIVYGPIIVVLLAWSTPRFGWIACLEGVALGYGVWTLTEYIVHRFLFHWEMTSPLGARIHFLLHGIHHEYPSDPLRLVMPLLMSVPGGAIAAAIMFAIGGLAAAPTLAGFAIGYVIYDSIHYHVHHGTARTAFGRFLKRAHMLHHFRDPHAWYGVSAPWWDFVFGTAGRV